MQRRPTSGVIILSFMRVGINRHGRNAMVEGLLGKRHSRRCRGIVGGIVASIARMKGLRGIIVSEGLSARVITVGHGASRRS